MVSFTRRQLSFGKPPAEQVGIKSVKPLSDREEADAAVDLKSNNKLLREMG